MKKKIFFLLIFLIFFNTQTFGVSQSYKLIKLGYTPHEVEQMLSGEKNRWQIDRERRWKRRKPISERIHSRRKKVSSLKIIPTIQSNLKNESRSEIRSAISEKKAAEISSESQEELKKELPPKELRYLKTVKAAATKYRVGVSWLMAIIKVESDFNHRAVSPKGAMGLMQIMPDTADYLGLEDPFEPADNIFSGTKYFAEQVETFGRMDLALAAYNAGPGLVKRLRRVPTFKETTEYVAKVFDYEEIYRSYLPTKPL
jgi:soluble lytic murein transglycosylase-like protein